MAHPSLPGAPLEPHRPALVLSAVCLGYAVQVADGFHAPLAIQRLAASLVLAWAAVLVPGLLRRLVPDRASIVGGLIALGLAAQLSTLMRTPFARYVAQPLPADQPGFIPLLVVAGLAAALAFVPGRRWRVAALALFVGAHAALGTITIRQSPDPAVDVVTVHKAAFAAIEQGRSPYSATFKDIYRGKHEFYPPGAVTGGVVQYGYPYPPLAVLMTWLGERWLGDFRYAELIAIALGAVAIAAASAWSPVGVLAVGLMLFTPRAFFGLEEGWTEPLLVLGIGIALWAWRGRRARVAIGAIAGLIAVKQYVVVAIPLAWALSYASTTAPVRGRLAAIVAGWRPQAAIALGAAALILPAFAWGFDGFMRSAVMVQVNEQLRTDALSFAVDYARWTGRELPLFAYLGIVAGAAALALWRMPPTPAGFAAALSVVTFTTFAFGKKAFCNYYLFVIAVTCAAVAASRAESEGDGSR